MTLVEDPLTDKLEAWIRENTFQVAGETVAQFWRRKVKDQFTYRLAKIGLDMPSIPAMSSDCERVFSQCKLMITS
jgi:hypothetical protein